MALHLLDSTPDTIHSYFSADLAPILTVEPGDRVRFRCLDAGFGLENYPPDGGDRPTMEPNRVGPHGHCLVGPVAVRGAEPGMHLAVRVEDLQPGPWGWTLANGLPPEGVLHRWSIAEGTASNQYGHRVRLAPFMGVMGLTPAGAGPHSTVPPRLVGGNLDCKELGVGTTLYLPVAVPGGLFSTGDGHARQGDGEVSGMALECPMEAEFSFTLAQDFGLPVPYARTQNSWLTFGLDPDLNVATRLALQSMVHLMARKYAVPVLDALALASVVVDLRITQVVNRTQGVHAVLTDDVLQETLRQG